MPAAVEIDVERSLPNIPLTKPHIAMEHEQASAGKKNEYELSLLGATSKASHNQLPPNLTTHSTQPSTFKVASVVAFYIVTSIAMIMVNKAVLNQAGLPLIFLWGQLIVAVIILKFAAILNLLTLPPVSVALFKSVAPLIAINVIGLILNTLCLHNIDAVMYQVARSLILPITVSLSPFMQSGQRVSFRVFMCCACITAGFLIGIFGESKFQVSTIGVVFGVLSSLTTAIHSFVIKSSFQNVKHNGAFDLVYYNNLFSAIFLAPVLSLEIPSLSAFIASGGIPALKVFIFGTLLAGCTGLLINLAGFLQIKTTSPLTHTVSSAARGVLQTITARAVLGEAITLARCIGITVTLLGSCLYSWVKSMEADHAKNDYNKIDNERGSQS